MRGARVLGARAAEALGLGPGNALLSSPETLFDLAGVYPITAIIAVPRDDKAGAILRGHLVSTGTGAETETQQILVPGETIEGPLADIFRIKSFLHAVILMAGAATVLALALVFDLSLRLRQGEIQTILKLGCSRATITGLLGAEIAIVLAASALLTGLLLVFVAQFDESLVRTLFIR